ncbi:MAG: hypothetical protein LBG73_04060 [Spirochaetaceae bacterium]|nr:hypothetical protein [Spirochaetaceae bacterium]
METHLGSCPQCRAQLEQFRRCSHLLKEPIRVLKDTPGTPDMEAAKERVWQKIRSLDRKIPPRRRKNPIWGRTVAVPLPAVAAAAAVVCAVLALTLIRQRTGGVPPPQEAVAAGAGMMDVQGIVPVSDMNDVLQYLGTQDGSDIVIIRLPESRNFSSSGEPTILKAADYTRRTGSR